MHTEDLDLDSVFTEPPRPPTPQPTLAVYTRSPRVDQDAVWSELQISLIGSHPLWGHCLWNSARALGTYLDLNAQFYKGKNVLELGAGGGLPGLVTALNGARKVVLTDYPDPKLVDNLQLNVNQNIPLDLLPKVSVLGYVWGTPVQSLLDLTSSSKFDLIIMSDLVFNHSQHESLLKTSLECLAPPDPTHTSDPPCILVFYTHHLPRFADRDMQFFTKASQTGWHCEKIYEQKFNPMFPEDAGDESIRSTVHGWKITRVFPSSTASQGAET